MKRIFQYKRISILGLLPASIALTLLAKHSSFFAEEIFALRIYRWISQIISTITGLIPISIAELLILSLPIILLYITIRYFVRLVKDKENRKERVFRGLLNVLCTGSMVYFLFTIFAGINYYRYSFSYYSNLEITKSSVQELYALTESLTMQANQLRELVPKTDAEGVFELSASMYEIADQANQAMEALSREYSVLGGSYGSPKPVLLSSAMSNTEITGIFIPFTMEANVNVHIPDYSIPATMLHELAHLRGFMREDEANYIAYLAGMESESYEFQYSSTMLALIISGNALYNQNTELYFKIREQYSPELLKDIRANSEYWSRYEDTVVSSISNKINDTYLKANDQADGVKSYGRMLDLLLAKFKSEQED